MAGNLENTGRDTSGSPSAESVAPAVAPIAEEPLIVAYFTRIDEKGCERKYVRTRGGREIRVLDESDAERFEKICPYDPDL